MDTVQELKALGYLAGVDLGDLARVAPAVDSANNRQVLIERQCGSPDRQDPELASAPIDKIAQHLGVDAVHANAIKQCHAAFDLAGSGSWGQCIRDLYPAHHAVKYYCDRESFPAAYRRKVTDAEIRELSVGSPWWGWSFDDAKERFNGKTVLDVCLLVGVEETYRLAGCAHVETQDHAESGIHILSRPIPGSTIGIGWFPGSGCRSHVEFHIDSGWSSTLQHMIWLFGHEDGHCNNLPHTFPGQDKHHDVMSYDRKLPFEGYSTGKAPHTLPRSPSWPQLERQYEPRPAPVLGRIDWRTGWE